VRGQSDDQHFLVAHNALSDCGGFAAGRLGGHKSAFLSFFKSRKSLENRLAKACPCVGYLEWEMFDAAALVIEEIAPEDKTRNEVLCARVNLYIAAKKWTWSRRLRATW
jgi:hypothetical protein